MRVYAILCIICFCASCANITAPTGGKKDTIPPKLLSTEPADSLLNTKIKKIVLHFDEYITISDVIKEVQVSPILSIPPVVTSKNKEVTIKLVDSLLEPNTTYRVSFGKAIKDLHEGNAFPNYTFVFSTGSYFDSLELNGKVINAAIGLPDTGLVYVVLYNASKPDSAVVKEKPKYVTKTDASGVFSLKGLPDKKFRIYAIKDINENLIYDGGDEMIGFYDSFVRPGDTASPPINLRIFKEIDTSKKKDTVITKFERPAGSSKNNAGKEALNYIVNLDTSDANKRTTEITKPVVVIFNKGMGFVADNRLTLSYDSAHKPVNAPASLSIDTARKNIVIIKNPWRENTVYTLRLLKGFAKDTANGDAMPSRYIFRTKWEADYGKLQIHLSSQYRGKKFLLMVNNETDTVYLKTITDTLVSLNLLKPAKYTLRIIIDKNGNGKWDPGDLFNRIQPEEVIPYDNVINLKPGWEDIIDFVPKTPTITLPPKVSGSKKDKSKPK